MRLRTVAPFVWVPLAAAAAAVGQSSPKSSPPLPDRPDGPPPAIPAPQPDRAGGFRSAFLAGEDGKPISSVRVVAADVRAVVRGPLAEAVVTLTFRNDQARPLGGELTFPLPDGATVSGYGLDVNGVMVDGVAVERDRARVVYETEVRKGVDPGLVERVAGNVFRTRVYPVMPRGVRTVKVAYTTDLAPAGGAGASLGLPLGLGEGLERFDLTVGVEGGSRPPSVRGGRSPHAAFEAVDRGFVLRESLKDAGPVDVLTVELPEVPASGAWVERRPREPMTIDDLDAAAAEKAPGGRPAADGVSGADHFFVLTDTPGGAATAALASAAVTSGGPANGSPAPAARRVLVVWDASLSRLTADRSRELRVLADALARLGHPAVDVELLRNDAEVGPSFEPGPGGTAKLAAYLDGAAYDGGTNLAAMRVPRNRAALAVVDRDVPDYDLAILVSDGQGTVGPADVAAAEVPVWALSADPAADHAKLRAVCGASGGAYLNLGRMSDEAAAAAVGRPPLAVVKVEFDPAQVADVTPGVGTVVAGEGNGGRVTLAGRLLAAEAKVTVVYGRGKVEASRRTFTIRAADAADGTLVARFWAQRRADALAERGDEARDELVALGKRYNLVTAGTSLLVLETLDQYVRYGVAPPKTMPELYRSYAARAATDRATKAAGKEQKVERVLAMWQARQAWWAAEHKVPPGFKYVAPPAKAEAAGRPLSAVADPAASSEAIRRPGEEATARPAAAPLPAIAADGARQVAAGGPAPMTPATRPPATPSPAAAAPAVATVAPGEPVGAVAEFNSRAAASDSTVTRFGSAGGGRAGGVMDSAKAVAGVQPSGPVARVEIKAWDPDTPYLRSMKAAPADKAYDVFLALRAGYARSPSFYLDCAGYLVDAGQRAAGVRVLTDVVELRLGDARLIRIAAHRLRQLGELDLAIGLFEQVAKLRPEEPQSFRDLALALADRADAALSRPPVARGLPGDAASRAVADYGRAVELLNRVVTGTWDRFPEIEVTALTEANAILAKLAALTGGDAAPVALDPRLRRNLDCDVRIVLTWDADLTDVDLWVTEPTGETCRYDHNRTAAGGMVSRDFTDGYGPEEYLLRRSTPGTYAIRANYYGSRQQELTGPCTVQATVITNFGRPDESRQHLTLRLAAAKDVFEVGKVELK